MELVTEIPVSRTRYSRIQDVDFDNLEFGKYVSDHMLICDYTGGEWHAPRNDDSTRGRGLLIIRSVMDDVQVTSADGTVVRMARRIGSPGPPGTGS